MNSDPSQHITIPLRLSRGLYESLSLHSEKNARPLGAEIQARLTQSLKENDVMMSEDRLMRLIFSRKLAYQGKKTPTNKSLKPR